MNEKVVKVELGERSYYIHIGLNTLNTIGERIQQFHFSHKAVLISNSHLIKLYGERIILNLKKNGFEMEVIEVPDGEKYKNMREAEKIYDRLLDGKHDRYSPLIAMGGGVLGDLTGNDNVDFLSTCSHRILDFFDPPDHGIKPVRKSG